MPRMNNQPFPCKDCKFADDTKETKMLKQFKCDAWCRRNPPSFVPGSEWGIFHLTHSPIRFNGEDDCFAGEPRVQRSCRNCKIDSTCFVRIRRNGQEICTPEDWHCSDWRAKE